MKISELPIKKIENLKQADVFLSWLKSKGAQFKNVSGLEFDDRFIVGEERIKVANTIFKKVVRLAK